MWPRGAPTARGRPGVVGTSPPVPWMPQSHGQRSEAFSEAVDVYPALADIAGSIPVPVSEGLQGSSLVPLLE